MEVEKQVSNKKLSKKLKYLGVEQESMFYWVIDKNDSWLAYIRTKEEFKQLSEMNYDCEIISAFTVAELGSEDYETTCFGDMYFCRNIFDKRIKVSHTEADARAKMKIYLIEYKLIVLQ